MSEYVERAVHPNSMAARKWKRTTWRSYNAPNLYAQAARAERAGDSARADALRRRAGREHRTSIHCG